MTEKRFHQFGLWVIDNPNFNGISIADLVDTELMSITEVVDLLNEQQTKIEELNELYGIVGRRLSKCNTEVVKRENKLNEQQATIDKLKEENEQLKEELQRFKKYVFTEDNILCYKCEHCIKKDIYVVDCEMKGKVDVHGLCSLFREVKV